MNQKPSSETNESGEDRENIPELDQTIEANEPVAVGNQPTEKNTDIVDEIRKFQNQQNKRNNPLPTLPSEERNPINNSNDEFLEF